MFDRIGRTIKDRVLTPLVRAVPRGATPDRITVTSLPFGLAAAICAGLGAWWWAFALYWLNRILDGLDGLVARERNMQTDFGGYLDIMIDFVVYACIPIGVWLGVGGPVWPLVILLAVFYVNAASWMYLSAVLEKRRAAGTGPAKATSVVMPSGLVEGTETVVFFALFLLFPDWYTILYALMAAGTLVGVAQRVLWAHHRLATTL